MASISETLASAFEHHQAGRLPQAAQLYQEILRRNPNQFDALQLLGIIAAQSHNHQLATECFSKAIKQNPSMPGLYYNLGNVLQEQGQLKEATASYRLALALAPNYAETHNNLGLALEKQGELTEAIASYKLAVALQPSQAQSHQNLGLALQKQGDLAAAIACFQVAVTLQPDCAGFQVNLANVLQEQQRWQEAIAHYQQALFLQPDSAEIYHNLGMALHSLERWDEAIAHYQQALVIQPDVAEIYSNMAATKRKQWRFNEAIADYRQALFLQPHAAEIHDNLGMILHEQLRLEEAILHYKLALNLKPNYANAHFNLSMALLLGGNLPPGFTEYEWRWQKVDSPPRPFSQPLWDGSSLKGKTVLLHGEQGFGDQIQFIRYVSLVAQFQGRIVVECSLPLVRLFTTVTGINQVVPRGETLPTFDVHAPLMSLPLILGTTLETIPAQIPYLYPSPTIPMPLATAANTLKVGITWAGSPLLTGNQNRFCSLEDFLPLLDIPNVALYSLQTGLQAQELTSLSVPIPDLSPQLNDFADTASMLAQLDLIISIDTAVAHLAGALGKPAWVILPFAPDWRWLLKREDSPWYPTLRLFRQSQPGDWAGVMQRVKQALLQWT